MEWTPEFLRIYVDSRLTYSLYLKFDEPFFKRGDFPPIVQNDTDFISTPNPWKDGTKNVAPFDQPFYLIMNVAVGGTNGWFPDGVGDKPWLDGSLSAFSFRFRSLQRPLFLTSRPHIYRCHERLRVRATTVDFGVAREPRGPGARRRFGQDVAALLAAKFCLL